VAVSSALCGSGKRSSRLTGCSGGQPFASQRPFHRNRGHVRTSWALAGRAGRHLRDRQRQGGQWLSQGAQPTERVGKLLKSRARWMSSTHSRQQRDRRPRGRFADDVNQPTTSMTLTTATRPTTTRRRPRRQPGLGRTPLAVVTYLVNSIASEPESVVINTESGTDRFVSASMYPRRHGPGHRPSWPCGAGHPHPGGRGRRPDGIQTNVDIVDD